MPRYADRFRGVSMIRLTVFFSILFLFWGGIQLGCATTEKPSRIKYEADEAPKVEPRSAQTERPKTQRQERINLGIDGTETGAPVVIESGDGAELDDEKDEPETYQDDGPYYPSQPDIDEPDEDEEDDTQP